MLSTKDAVKKLVDHYLSTNEARKRFVSVLCGLSTFKAINLQPPKSKDMLSDIASFQKFLLDWRVFPYQDLIVYAAKSNKYMDREQLVPEKLLVSSVEEFVGLLSATQRKTVLSFAENIQKLEKLFPDAPENCFYKLVNSIWDIDENVFENICLILPQLKKDLGKDLYIRALPVNHIDTKFLENNEKLIFLILQLAKPQEFFKTENCVPAAAPEFKSTDDSALIDANESSSEEAEIEGKDQNIPIYASMHDYLGVREKPSGFVYMRVCDKNYLERVGNFSIIMVSATDLLNVEPPCSNLIVVENEQSGFMLPDLPDTSVIFGCGNNLSWSKAQWLKNKKRIYYWGDIDSWGYFMLSQFRSNAGAEVDSLMMDMSAINLHTDKMVAEPSTKEINISESSLNAAEIEAYDYLRKHGNNRLEQEKLDQNFVLDTIKSLFAET